MRAVTDLSKDKIYAVFDMLDVDHSGMLDFDEFYLLICILIAVRVSCIICLTHALHHPHSPPTHTLSLSLVRTNWKRSSSTVTRGQCLSCWMLMGVATYQEMSLKTLDFSSTSKCLP